MEVSVTLFFLHSYVLIEFILNVLVDLSQSFSPHEEVVGYVVVPIFHVDSVVVTRGDVGGRGSDREVEYLISFCINHLNGFLPSLPLVHGFSSNWSLSVGSLLATVQPKLSFSRFINLVSLFPSSLIVTPSCPFDLILWYTSTWLGPEFQQLIHFI